MTEVIPFPRVADAPSDSHAARMIEQLQDMLREVREGEFSGVFLVGCHADGSGYATRWVFKASETSNLIGALEALKHDLLAARS